MNRAANSQPKDDDRDDAPEARTAIGVDLGVKRSLVAAPPDPDPDVSDALVVGGSVERDLYDGLGDTLARLDELAVSTDEAEAETIETYRSLLRQRFGLAVHALVEYADRHDADVVAFEDVNYKRGALAECARNRTKASEWVLPALRERLEVTLAAEDYRVERVNAAYSTQRCHVCGELSDLSPATITCETEGCPVDAVCRDRSAAVTIAQRGQGGQL